MRRLGILRHAKSDWGDPGLTDFDRPLNKRGHKAARAVGKEIRDRGIRFDQIIASSAMRVRETLARFEYGYGEGIETHFQQHLYLPSTATLMAVIHAIPDSAEGPLLAGHNPGLHDLVLRLTQDDPQGLRHKVAGNFPTAAFALIEFPIDHWSDVAPGLGEIRELILPREL